MDDPFRKGFILTGYQVVKLDADAIRDVIPLSESLPATRCRHRIVPSCGSCEYGKCGKYDRHTTLSLCVDCIRAGKDG